MLVAIRLLLHLQAQSDNEKKTTKNMAQIVSNKAEEHVGFILFCNEIKAREFQKLQLESKIWTCISARLRRESALIEIIGLDFLPE